MLVLSQPIRLSRPGKLRLLVVPLHQWRRKRHAMAGDSENAYFDRWQRSRIKPSQHYDEWAEKRHYFYVIDLQGRLYLEQSPIKNVTSCLKDNKVWVDDGRFRRSMPSSCM